MAYSAVGRRSPEIDRPSMSDLRIVLLGKSVSENSQVGNFLLGRAAFDIEAPLDVVERVGGRLKDRHVMVINSPQLLQTNISDHQITETVRECVSLSDPGPHVFILVLQHNDFTEEDMRRVKYVLEKFSEEAIKRTIVVTKKRYRLIISYVMITSAIQQLIKECGGGSLQLDERKPECQSEILDKMDKILEENKKECLTCERYEDVEGRSVAAEQEKKDNEKRLFHKDDGTPKDSDEVSTNVSGKQKLNLVLCGSDATLTVSVLKQLQGKTISSSHQQLNSEECVRRHVELHGRLISLVVLPTLFNTQLSEEEVMHQTLRCVSLCDPGVHVFLLIVPAGPLTDEDKAEMEEIQRIFSSRINKYLMFIRILDENLSQINLVAPASSDIPIQTFGGHRFVLGNSSQVPALLQDVEKMVQENKESYYSTFMYLQAQLELERNKHRAEIEQLRKAQLKAGVTHSDVGVRIVLLGKTGVGKSATGNTILRGTAFKSKLTSRSVTRECQKETTEFDRRQITVIDTPGLFDTGVDNVETKKEIVKCVSMAAPGPHVFLLVIQLGRFTQEEKDAVKMIQETFGDESRTYSMVLFTRGDELRGTTIEDFIEGDDSLKNLVHQFGNRYHVFNNNNNNETKDRNQVSELLDKIDCLVTANGGSFYTNEMFQLVEKDIKEEEERIMKEKEEENKRKEEKLRDKYDEELEQMKKANEIERQEMQNELRKREEEFKKKEEEIKKETDEIVRKELQQKLDERQKLSEENERKEKALQEQLQNFIKYLKEKHKKEKQKLQEKIQHETREQAECEYREKLEDEVAKALKKAEEKVPFRSKRARDWSQYVPVFGGVAGGAVGSIEDIVHWIIRKTSSTKSMNEK